MAKSALLVIKSSPYGTYCGICPYEAKRAAVGLSGEDIETKILLINDGVYFLLKGQDPSDLQMQSFELAFQDLEDFDIELIAHKPSVEERALQKEEIMDVDMISDDEVTELIRSSDILINF